MISHRFKPGDRVVVYGGNHPEARRATVRAHDPGNIWEKTCLESTGEWVIVDQDSGFRALVRADQCRKLWAEALEFRFRKLFNPREIPE